MLCDSPDVDQWIHRDREGWGESVQRGQSFSFAEGRVLEVNGGGVHTAV